MEESTEIQRFQAEGVSLIEAAQSIRIVDQASRESAMVFRANVNGAVKKIKSFFEPIKTKAHAAWKAICNQENELTGKFEEAKQIIDREITRDFNEQRRLQEESERKVKLEAEEKEKKEREKLESQALKEMEKGNFDKAEQKLDAASRVFVPVISPVPPPLRTIKVNGVSATMVSDLEIIITDPISFFREIANGKLPLHLAEIKLNEVKKYAKAMRVEQIPGLRITKTSRVSSRV